MPEYQGKGIGTMLLNAILACLRQKGVSEFCLDSTYKKAQSYWTKKLGQPSVTLKDYWGKGLNYMIWHRNLNGPIPTRRPFQNSKMILFQQGRTLPLFWNGLQAEPWTQPFSAPLYPYR